MKYVYDHAEAMKDPLIADMHRRWEHYMKLRATSGAEFARWMMNHPHRDVIGDALARLAELRALTELTSEASGDAPPPLEKFLQDLNIITPPVIEIFKKQHRLEARH